MGRKSRADIQRERLQQDLLKTWGPEIKALKVKLCANCRHDKTADQPRGGACILLPITSDGYDCPYFGAVELKCQTTLK